MSLSANPQLFLSLSPEEQLATVRRLRTITQQPVTLKAELARDSGPKAPRAQGVTAAKVQATKNLLGI
jgi:hypothetical protein